MLPCSCAPTQQTWSSVGSQCTAFIFTCTVYSHFWLHASFCPVQVTNMSNKWKTDCTPDTPSALQWPLVYLFPQTHLQCKALSLQAVQHSDLEATESLNSLQPKHYNLTFICIVHQRIFSHSRLNVCFNKSPVEPRGWTHQV